MTATFTFTADAGTDELTTSAPHGLVTGDGPVAVRNDGGALPDPLAAVTDYFAIVTGASTLQLATSSANALSGTEINLIDAGTGTHHLEIGIPYRRARTYVAASVSEAGAQLKSADLNDMQDAFKALYALLTGQSQSLWDDVRFNVPVASLLNLAAGAQLTAGPLIVQGILSPAALSAGNNNNYNPAGLDSAIVLRLTPGVGSLLTGIAAPSVPGQTLVIFNLGTDDLTVTHEDGSSSAANRILLPNATASVVVRDNGSITLWYDGTSSRWRVQSQNL
jgi:hypothetical protein